MKSMRQAVMAAAMVFIAACGGSKTTGPQYQGEPLFTVRGQLSLAQGTAPANPIRLAVAWYPDQTSNSDPRGILTQDVQYQGSFPLNYTFSLFGVPPPSALTQYTQGAESFQAAWGVLLAYEDLNGNGQLDTIPGGGSPVDHILGTSIGDVYNGAPAADPVYVAYVDGTPPASWAGFAAGYNLWKSQQVVPSTTPVELNLVNTNELDFLVCEEFVSGTSRSFDLPCNIAPTGGMRVIGNVYLADGVAGASIRVTDGQQPLGQATVELNGKPVSYSAAEGTFIGYGPGLVVNAPGVNELKVTLPGGQPRSFRMTATGGFSLRSPKEGARVPSGAAVPVQWTAASGAGFYQVRLFGSSALTAADVEQVVYPTGLGLESASVTAPAADDFHQVQVVAFDRDYLAQGLGGSFVNVALLRSTYVDVIPAALGLAASGQLTVMRYQGALSHSAWLTAYDGVSAIPDGRVSVNGTALAWDPTYSMYGIDGTSLLTSGANAVSVALAGKPAFASQVQVPGDFTVTAPPSSAQKGSTLNLTWTASAGAQEYRVWISDATGAPVSFGQTTGTSIAVSVPDQAGPAFLSVAALGPQGDRHLSGMMQNLFDLNVTP